MNSSPGIRAGGVKVLKPNENWAKQRPQKDRWPKKEEEYPFSAKKNTALQPSLPLCLPPSLPLSIIIRQNSPRGKNLPFDGGGDGRTRTRTRTDERRSERGASVHSKSDSVVSLEWSGKRPISLRPSVRHSGLTLHRDPAEFNPIAAISSLSYLSNFMKILLNQLSSQFVFEV